MMKMLKKKRRGGFTLIELIVVIAILGILAAIAIPRLTGSRDSANRNTVLADLRVIESAIAIAEAEGNVGIDYSTKGTNFYGLVPNYLATEPKGPDKVSAYTIATERAEVTFTEANVFGVTITVGPHNIEDLLGTTGW